MEGNCIHDKWKKLSTVPLTIPAGKECILSLLTFSALPLHSIIYFLIDSSFQVDGLLGEDVALKMQFREVCETGNVSLCDD